MKKLFCCGKSISLESLIVSSILYNTHLSLEDKATVFNFILPVQDQKDKETEKKGWLIKFCLT